MKVEPPRRKSNLLSNRVKNFNFDKNDIFQALCDSDGTYKGALSEYGWIYLVNDSSNFMRFLFGQERWSSDEHFRAIRILMERKRSFDGMGVQYCKFIIPEKAVVYSEFLPKALGDLPQYSNRPACIISNEYSEFVFYFDTFLRDAKSYGQLFFRADSHTTWLGSYLAYSEAIRLVNSQEKVRLGDPIPLRVLSKSLFGFDGDLFHQISPQQKSQLCSYWLDILHDGAFEYGVKYTLPLNERRAKSVVLSGDLASYRLSREILIREVQDCSLPRAVIFRDSTTDFMIDLLAEHFQRTVFVWHRGEVIREIIEREQPDIVLHFMAERFVTSYGNTGVSFSSVLT